MEIVRKINNELAIAGQVTPDQLQQLARDGFRSILNLRSPNEKGNILDEQAQVEALGLMYLNIPVTFDLMNEEIVGSMFGHINLLAKPVLVHCDTGIRAAAIVLMHIAMRQGATPKQAFQQAEKLGLFGVLSY